MTRETPALPGCGAFWRLTPLACAVMWLSGCVSMVQRDVDSHRQAGRYEQALQTLEEGMRQHPYSTELRSQYLRARHDWLTELISQAAAAQAQGRLDEAEHLLQRAQQLDGGNARVADQWQRLKAESRAAAALQEATQLRERGLLAAALKVVDEGLKGRPAHEGLQQLRRGLSEALRERQVREVSKGLAERRPISLDFKDAQLRQVLDLVSRHSGLNFVLDKDIRPDIRVTTFLKNVRVEDALDLLVSTHQLARKVLDERTVLIYPNTADKQREYQEQVIRVFYLGNAEAKGAALFLKSMLRLKEPFVDERSNMVAVRESPEMAQLAERLVALYDAQEPEVMLELEVLEIRSTRLTELGISFPQSVSLSPLASSSGALTISSLRGLDGDRIGVTVGNTTLNLRREVGDFEILANPRVRAKNREKAKVLIGDKVPVFTTTTSQTGFVADSVSYLDVGLKLEVEPTVFANDEVAIKLALEVGALASQSKTASGSTAYVVNTRNASTALRLKDGETQVLAGLLRREDRSSANRVPLLGDAPVLGRLFSSQLDDGSKTELVLAITPHIVRNVRPLDASEAELWIGTEAYTRLRGSGGRAWGDDVAPAATSPGGLAPAIKAGGGDAPSPSAQPPTGAGGTVGAEAGRPAPAWTPPPAALPGQPDDVAAPLAPPLSLRWQGPGAAVRVGSTFDLALLAPTPRALKALSLQVQATPGALAWVSTEAQPVEGQTLSVDTDSGRWQWGRLSLDGPAAPLTLPPLTLRALKPGRVQIELLQADAVGPKLEAVPVALPPRLQIDVKP